MSKVHSTPESRWPNQAFTPYGVKAWLHAMQVIKHSPVAQTHVSNNLPQQGGVRSSVQYSSSTNSSHLAALGLASPHCASVAFRSSSCTCASTKLPLPPPGAPPSTIGPAAAGFAPHVFWRASRGNELPLPRAGKLPVGTGTGRSLITPPHGLSPLTASAAC